MCTIGYAVWKGICGEKAHSLGGEIGKIEYIADKMNAPILVFGSSRATHHYDPRILADSLGMDAYNCGLDGNGIIFTYGQYSMFKNRYIPKLVICELSSGFDLLYETDNRKYINYLRPNYSRGDVASIVQKIDTTERWKMWSQAYRFNTHFVKVILGVKMSTFSTIKGYLPIDRVMNYEPQHAQEVPNSVFVYDSLKLFYWHQLIADCRERGTKLVFAISPKYRGGKADEAVFKPLLDLAEANDIPVINHYSDTVFSTKKEYFYDSTHMNIVGATAYTRQLASELRPLLVDIL